ncbi:MAG: ferrous iron transport protein B [Candidatus Hydrogenedentes bacterium]|nr:ferrous iron transport protein B [Candidatus Hydrogenedentota bacterium]
MIKTIALVGNPNVGKTTLFNALTGLSHVTGNYPGVTVERKAGKVQLNGKTVEIVDLPGTYSLAARSPDEMIVTDLLLGNLSSERPIDAVVSVVDATNIERNLYLVSQLRELGKPLVIALNMTDIAESHGIQVSPEKIACEIGVPVVPVSAHKNVGVERLKEVLSRLTRESADAVTPVPTYPEAFNREVDALTAHLVTHSTKLGRKVPRAEAFRVLVDKGGYAETRLAKALANGFMDDLSRRRERANTNGSLASLEARSRYTWIRKIVAAGVTRPETRVITWSDRVDHYVTHKVYGTIIFVAVMAVVFQAIFSWAAPLMQLISDGFTALGGLINASMPDGMLRSLLADGVIAGFGSVVTFIPQILILSLFIALLEDCGYMSRAAFLMDKLLSKCGLSGQSFIPLLSSFACAIPGILATRTISNRRDRFTTMLVAPLMSCSARLPIYTMMIAAFIPGTHVLGGLVGLQGLTLFFMYLLGITVAVPTAWLLKKTLLKGETPPFLLELPTYKWPQPRTVAIKVYTQGREFLLRAGTLIFSIAVRDAIVASVSDTADRDAQLGALAKEESGAYLRNSIIGHLGQAVAPVVRPLGWDWRIGMAALASFPAREVVVATLGTIFNLGSDVDETSQGLRATLRDATTPTGGKLFTIPVALSIMVFFALCSQCGSTLAILKRETGKWRWPLFVFGYLTTLAYLVSFAVFHITTAVGWGSV